MVSFTDRRKKMTVEQIKEIAQMAMENGYDFNIDIKGDNTNISVKKPQNQTTYIPQTQDVRDIKITYPDTRYPWGNVWYDSNPPYYYYPTWYYDSNKVTCDSNVSGSNATQWIKTDITTKLSETLKNEVKHNDY